MKKAVVVSLVVCAAFAGATVLYVLFSGSDESLYFARNSFHYYLYIDSFIENAPRPQIIGEPLYYNSAGDGAKQPATGISFRSSAAKAEIYDSIHRYLAGHGYRPDGPARVENHQNGESLSEYAYESDEAFVRLLISCETDGVRQITLTRHF